MRLTLTLLFVLSCLACFSQGDVHTVEPVGVYKEIDMTNTIRIVKLLVDTSTNFAAKNKLIDSIEQNPNNYIPPVLYVLSYEVFNSGNKMDGSFWFYLAQLRARYDVNRCADKTANASEYNSTFGPAINKYALIRLDTLQQVITKVVAFERSNQENYDQRWINLTGMNAMSEGLSKKSDNKPLSLPKNEWAEIRKKTIDDYYNDFENYVMSKKK